MAGMIAANMAHTGKGASRLPVGETSQPLALLLVTWEMWIHFLGTNIHPRHLDAIRDIQFLCDRVSCRPVDQQHRSDRNRNSEISQSAPDPPLQELAVTKDFEGIGNDEGAEHKDHGQQGNVGLHGGLTSGTVDASIFLGGLTVFRSLQKGVRLEDLAQLIEGLIDEEQGNEPGKDVLGKPGEESDESRSFKAGDREGDDKGPEADPEPPRQEEAREMGEGENKEAFVIKQDRASHSNYDQWTSSQQCKNYACNKKT